jgi:hypothetical protein
METIKAKVIAGELTGHDRTAPDRALRGEIAPAIRRAEIAVMSDHWSGEGEV